MIRLSLLVMTAIALPATGRKAADVNAPSNSAPVVTASWAPHIRMPHLPHLPRFSRNHRDEMIVAQMNVRLRSLVVQQEAYYSDNGIYGRNVNRLPASAVRDSASSHVQVEILFAGKKGWTATASHPDAPGKSCTIFVGNREGFPIVPRTRAEGMEATMEGIPACDK